MNNQEFSKYLHKTYRIKALREMCAAYNIEFRKDQNAKSLSNLLSRKTTYEKYLARKTQSESKKINLIKILPLIPVLYILFQVYSCFNQANKPYGICEGTRNKIYGPTIQTKIREDVKIYFSGSKYSFSDNNLFCIPLKNKSECMLELRVIKRQLELFAKFYDYEGALVGQIVGNKFILNENCIYRWKYDDNSIEIIDDKFNVILQINYIKKTNEVFVNGVFWDGNKHLISNQIYREGFKVAGQDNQQIMSFYSDLDFPNGIVQ